MSNIITLPTPMPEMVSVEVEYTEEEFAAIEAAAALAKLTFEQFADKATRELVERYKGR